MTFVDFIRQQEKRPPKLEEVVEELKRITFFCGSRWFKERNQGLFGGDLDFSTVDDWDFSYSRENYSVEATLAELGFKRQTITGEHMEMYGDNSFSCLWKHPDYKIDVVGRFDFDQYKKVWTNVYPEFYHKYLWKSAPHRVQDQEAIREHKVFIRDWLNQAMRIP